MSKLTVVPPKALATIDEAREAVFSKVELQKSEAPRVSIGDPEDRPEDAREEGSPVVPEIFGQYMGSKNVGKNDNGSPKLVHRIVAPYVVFSLPDGEPVSEVDLWGCFQLDRDLPALPIGTLVRCVFDGYQKSSKNKTRKFKRVTVMYPKNTKLGNNVFTAEFTEDVPF